MEPNCSRLVSLLLQFAYLQLLDLLTTVAFLVHGIAEANPFVRWVLNRCDNPLTGLVVVKGLAVLLGLYCWRMRKSHVLWRMNLLFALVVAWNLGILIIGSARAI